MTMNNSENSLLGMAANGSAEAAVVHEATEPELVPA
jgi:hypothetical protein